MVVAAQRAFSDAKKWLRAGRPRRIERNRFAWRAFGATFVAGLTVLGLISLVAPNNFGNPGSSTIGSGWPLYVIIGLIALCALYALIRREHVRWLLNRFREPFARRLDRNPGFEGAADALAECPGPYKTRFAAVYIWAPAALAVLGATFSFSAAYFVVDAVLARFAIGWEQAVYAAAFTVASVIVFALAAGRLATWRLAVSVYKEVTTGYP